MKKLSLATLAIAVAATFAAAALAGDNETQVLNQIAGYRQWTRVNPQPIKIDAPATLRAGTFSIPMEVAV